MLSWVKDERTMLEKSQYSECLPWKVSSWKTSLRCRLASWARTRSTILGGAEKRMKRCLATGINYFFGRLSQPWLQIEENLRLTTTPEDCGRSEKPGAASRAGMRRRVPSAGWRQLLEDRSEPGGVETNLQNPPTSFLIGGGKLENLGSNIE